MSRKQAKRLLKANPGFEAWLKEKPEEVTKVRENPTVIQGMFEQWKKQQTQKEQLERIEASYRHMINQFNELNTLLQRADQIAGNVKAINKNIKASKLYQTMLLSSRKSGKKVV
ncbi:hypothetical protein [Ammoniphilus resinae]|uniref:Uncharacterized protein n=1 Tax=Ammoniphilus resinae TaxID=861532 RepID=A0ABS4GK28_9BACL|nr:hypothetical protein [Ammoniphilus resinae]MBP1930615.1 hypothetical protein [Ammoniphilus resinae]